MRISGTPFTPRVAALAKSGTWSEWSTGEVVYLRPETFWDHGGEVAAMRDAAILEDKSPLEMYFFSGPDVAEYLQRLVIRDISKMELRHAYYNVFCDDRGKLISDGLLFRMSEQQFCYTASPLDVWYAQNAEGFDVTVENVTEEWGILHIQGPASDDILARAAGQDLSGLRFSRGTEIRLASADVWVWRQGFTGERGFEFWIRAEDALDVWDALYAAGEPLGMMPLGDMAEDVGRIEAGLILPVIDYTRAGPDNSTHSGDPTAPQHVQWEATPEEMNIGRFVDFGKGDFVGRDALLAERQSGGPARRLVGLRIDGRDIAAQQLERGVPPRVPQRWKFPFLPVRSGDGHIGYVNSIAWSPRVGGLIGLARIGIDSAEPGTNVLVDWSLAGSTYEVGAVVSELPFVDMKRRNKR
ncbi:MAG: aminomethyltransferase family protein [Acidimicrobiaceae bacterium]|nr:aminomethyltransferase family protein [Acidimicrobiaceae bacterium]